MSKAISVSTHQALTPQEAAAQIIALINARPQTPWPDEIAAIISRVGAASTSLSPLCADIRNGVAKAIAIADGPTEPFGSEQAWDNARREQDDHLRGLLERLPEGGKWTADEILVLSEATFYFGDRSIDGTTLETIRDGDCFEKPASILIEAVMQYFGSQIIPEQGDRLATEEDYADADFEPILSPDGKPLIFDYTNEGFANAYLPAVHTAFHCIGQTKAKLEEGMRRFLEEDPELAMRLVDSLQGAAEKFEAISHFMRAAENRLMVCMCACKVKAEQADAQRSRQ